MGGSKESKTEKALQELQESYKRLESHVQNLEKSLIKQVVTETVKELRQERTDPLKNEILKRFKRNRKELIQSKILELLEHQEIELPELKDIIVDRFKYCSKPTFYRYFKELLARSTVSVASVGLRKIVRRGLEKPRESY